LSAKRRRTVVLIGDVHHEIARLERSFEAVCDRSIDLVLLAGDLGKDPSWDRALRRKRRSAHDESVRRVVARAGQLGNAPVVFVPGNHDLDDPPTDVAGVNADRRLVEVADLRIAGFGGAGPTRFGFPYEWSEEEAGTALERLLGEAGPVDIFLSHAPPFDTSLDRTAGGVAVGSPSVGHWIARARPRLFVCGHIHEAWGVEWRGGIACVNAGAMGEPYARELAWVVEWGDGPERIVSFERGGTGEIEARNWTP